MAPALGSHRLLEPVGRNTAAAIALAALYTRERFTPATLMWVCPSDHLVANPAALYRALDAALPVAAAGRLLTFGITPTRPETGYGYIRFGAPLADAPRALQVTRFVEKPQDPAVHDSLRVPAALYERLGIAGGGEDLLLASMGIYIFRRDVLTSVLDSTQPDFGRHIIPTAIASRRVLSYIFQGYWEDIGTIRAFFDANLELASDLPRFNFFDMTAPMFTRPRWLPAST